MADWYRNPSGKPCQWCADDLAEVGSVDPDNPARELCRSHLAEYEGTSLDGLDRMEADERADMDALGYND